MIVTKNDWKMLAYTPLEFNYLEILAETFIISVRQNQFIEENIFNDPPVSRIGFGVNINSAFTGSFTESPFRYQQIDLRQTGTVRRFQPIVDFWCCWQLAPLCYDKESNALWRLYTLNCNWYVQRVLSNSVSFDFNAGYYGKLSLTRTIWRTTEAGSKLFFLKNTLLNSLCWENECLRLQLSCFVLVEKIFKMDNVFRRRKINRIPLLTYRYSGYFPSAFVPTPDHDTFAIINTYPSNHIWIVIANFCQIL